MNTLTDAQLVVSSDVAALLDRLGREAFDAARSAKSARALDLLQENGFLVADREHDRQALDATSPAVKSDTSELNVTVLTTLQCNFACDYCFQGDHGDYNKFAEKMSLETAGAGRRLDRARARSRAARDSSSLTFFGGEPLLNLPVMYYLAERLWRGDAGARRPMLASASSPTACCSPRTSSIACCRSG